MTSNNQVPWIYPVPDQDLGCLLRYIKTNSIEFVYEFGCGKSTLELAKVGVIVVSFETHLAYARSVAQFICQQQINPTPSIYHYTEDLKFSTTAATLPKAPLCFVDGPKGTSSLSRLTAIKLACNLAQVVILHDAERPGEQESIEEMIRIGWQVSYLPNASTPKQLAVLTKPQEEAEPS